MGGGNNSATRRYASSLALALSRSLPPRPAPSLSRRCLEAEAELGAAAHVGRVHAAAVGDVALEANVVLHAARVLVEHSLAGPARGQAKGRAEAGEDAAARLNAARVLESERKLVRVVLRRNEFALLDALAALGVRLSKERSSLGGEWRCAEEPAGAGGRFSREWRCRTQRQATGSGYSVAADFPVARGGGCVPARAACPDRGGSRPSEVELSAFGGWRQKGGAEPPVFLFAPGEHRLTPGSLAIGARSAMVGSTPKGAAFHASLLRPGEGEKPPVPRNESRPLLARSSMQGVFFFSPSSIIYRNKNGINFRLPGFLDSPQITRRFSDHPASSIFCLADHPTRTQTTLSQHGEMSFPDYPTRRNVVSRLPNTAKCRFQVTRQVKFLFPDHPVVGCAG